MPSGESIAIAERLAAVEALVASGDWAEVQRSLASDIANIATNAELCATYGEALLRLGRPRDAFEWLQPRLDSIARTANWRAWLRTVNLTGAAAFELGRIPEAERYFSTALESATAMGDHLTGARALNNLALVASTRGDWGTAMNYYTLALPSYERTASVRGLAECSHNIAATALESGDLDLAEEWERRAMELARETGNERLRAFTLGGRAEILLRRRDFSLAIVIGRQGAALFRELGDQSSEAHALRLVGQAELGLGDPATAERTLSRAVALAAESSVLRVLGECLLARAHCFIAMSDPVSARDDLQQARAHFSALGSTEKVRGVDRLQQQLGIVTSSGGS